jgi:sarcosine oxidase, subunit gamma
MAAELKLERGRPLDGFAEELSKASSDAVRLQTAPARSVINLRGTADESLVTDAQMALGVELPLMPNRWHGGERMAAIWLGPDEWLIVAPQGEAANVEQAMREARPNDPWLSLVDVSHNYTRVALSGPSARDVLAKGCALDLRPDQFATGDCAQTVLAKAPVLLRALPEVDSFELWFRNSHAGYLAVWLLDAVRF